MTIVRLNTLSNASEYREYHTCGETWLDYVNKISGIMTVHLVTGLNEWPRPKIVFDSNCSPNLYKCESLAIDYAAAAYVRALRRTHPQFKVLK